MTSAKNLTHPGRRHLTSTSNQGLALIAVLWLVAALSIMVAGLSSSIRQEARTGAGKRDVVVAQSIGDAAIQVALQRLRAENRAPDKWMHTEVSYQGLTLRVEVTPLSGLIDINQADVLLLTRLYAVAGGVASGEAELLAQATIDTRDKLRRGAISQRFEAEEDLLSVPGVTYDLYARLAPLLTAEARGGARVNPHAASAEVLMVLAGGDSNVVGNILAKRRNGDIGIDMSGLDVQLIDGGASTRVKVAVDVPVDSGKFVRLARHVDLMSQSPDGTPWTTYRLSSSVQAARSDN